MSTANRIFMPRPGRERRPRSVTIAGWIFIALGVITLGAGLWPLVESAAANGIGGMVVDDSADLILVLSIRLIAVIGGVYLLYGHNWARWLLVAWMLFHIAISFMHSAFEVIMHTLIFGLIIYMLFRPEATAYLRPGKTREGGSSL